MRRVAVIGAGTMGRRLAVDFIRCGHLVSICDVRAEAVADARSWIARVLQEWKADGRVDDTTVDASLNRLTSTPDPGACVVGAEFVFENVPERLELKRCLFRTLAPLLDTRTIIVSNTSSLPGSLMQDASGRGDRFINANFGHLGHRKVEVMGHAATSGATRDAVVAFLRACEFVPIVLHREQFGYASNRLWRAIKKEVLRQLDAGIVTPDAVDRAWMLDWHVPIGPCGVMDRIGLDVVRDIEQAWADHTGDPSDRPPPLLEAMVHAGTLGVKSGAGFYRYPQPPYAEPGFLEAS